MTRHERLFNDGWEVHPKVNFFLEMTAGPAPRTAVTIPHDAMIRTERSADGPPARAYFPDGVWQYEKTFDAPDDWRDKRVTIEFEGVYRSALVRVNDVLAASRPYGYSQFSFSLDPYLRHGQPNHLMVECRAHDDARWYSGAGIYRDVHLTVTGLVHVAHDGVTVTTPEVDTDVALVAVDTTVSNESPLTRTAHVRSDIVDPAGQMVASSSGPVTLRPGDTHTLRQRIAVPQPKRWGVDHPDLYTCRTTMTDGATTIDEVSTTFGIRTLTVDAHRGLRINGEVVKLRGACVHHDNGLLGSATIARAEERRVERLKAAGFNAIRSAHNPMSRAMLDACDRLGVLVMDEAFDVWTEPKMDHDYATSFADWWEADIEAMVRKDRNHPSVIVYSLGNEIPDIGTPLGGALSRQMAEKVRALDPTRFTTQAVQVVLAVKDLFTMSPEEDGNPPSNLLEAISSGVNTNLTSFADLLPKLQRLPAVADRVEEACAAVDIVGYNYMDARYELDHDIYPQRVIVGSETAIGRLAEAWPVIVRHPHLLGDFTWTGWDYLGEVGIGRPSYVEPGERPGHSFLGEYPYIAALAGDIDITGERRVMSYFREIVFGLRAEPYVAVVRPQHFGKVQASFGMWSWADAVSTWTWTGHEGSPVAIEVYAPGDEVELIVNDNSVGRQPAGPGGGYIARFEAVYQPGSVTAVAYSDGHEIGRTTLVTAIGPAVLTATLDRNHIGADGTDLAYIAISLADTAGTVVPTASSRVTVTCDGPGVLQALGSADPMALRAIWPDGTPTYDGRAQAIIRPTAPGRVTIAVTADDHEPVVLHFEAS